MPTLPPISCVFNLLLPSRLLRPLSTPLPAILVIGQKIFQPVSPATSSIMQIFQAFADKSHQLSWHLAKCILLNFCSSSSVARQRKSFPQFLPYLKVPGQKVSYLNSQGSSWHLWSCIWHILNRSTPAAGGTHALRVSTSQGGNGPFESQR